MELSLLPGTQLAHHPMMALVCVEKPGKALLAW
jgi:hypothetical protein